MWPEDRGWAFLGSLAKCYLALSTILNSRMCIKPSRESAQNEKRVVSVTLLNVSRSARGLSPRPSQRMFEVVDRICTRGKEASSADAMRIMVTNEVMSGNYRIILIIY